MLHMTHPAHKPSISERMFWAFISVIRWLPFTRGKGMLFGRLLSNRPNPAATHVFRSKCGLPLRWSSRGLPDLLTRHMLLYGAYQEDVAGALANVLKPGDVMFDVGAHHGLMSVVGALRVASGGKVVAFEPNAPIHGLFKHFVEINQVSQVVELHACGVSDVEAQLPFYARQDQFAWNSSFERQFADPEGKLTPMTVPVTTLDRFVETSGTVPAVIKIDTEGTEFSVLRGGRRLLRERHPKLILEMNPQSAAASGYRVADEVQFLRELGYQLYALPQGRVSQKEWWGALEVFDEARHCPNGNLANVICMDALDPVPK